MYVTEAQVAELVAALGRPARLWIEQPVTEAEMAMIQASRKGGRAHDLTVFAFDPAGRVAVIRKPFFPAGAYRAPSGGALPGEPLARAAEREFREETGAEARLHRYVLRVHAVFVTPAARQPWTSHVLTAWCAGGPLEPRDRGEIAEARWCTREELAGPIRQALLRSGLPLFRYRVALTDAVLALCAQHPELVPACPPPGAGD